MQTGELTKTWKPVSQGSASTKRRAGELDSGRVQLVSLDAEREYQIQPFLNEAISYPIFMNADPPQRDSRTRPWVRHVIFRPNRDEPVRFLDREQSNMRTGIFLERQRVVHLPQVAPRRHRSSR